MAIRFKKQDLLIIMKAAYPLLQESWNNFNRSCLIQVAKTSVVTDV